MIGKVITFIMGFFVGLIFGTAIGRWFLERLVEYLQGRI